MELASYLAGEPWSDHPRCTHPLVAVVARLVNDHMSDGQRQRLSPLIPEVIGLTSDDGRVDANIALRCATSALPIAAAERQNVLVVAILAAERALAAMEGRPLGELQPRSIAALDSAPHATARGRTFFGRFEMTVDEFRQRGAPHIARLSVVGIAESCTLDTDDRLYDLLVGAMDDCRAYAGPALAPPLPSRWSAVVDLVVSESKRSAIRHS